MPLPVDVHPEAIAEARAATKWYRERDLISMLCEVVNQGFI